MNYKIHLDTRVRQSIEKYSWTPACDSQFENTPRHPCDSHFPKGISALSWSFWQIGTRQTCMKWLLIIRYVNSVNHVNNVNSVNSINSVSSLLRGATFISDGIFCFLHCFNNSKFNFARFGLIIQVNVILETLYTKAASVKSLKKIAHQVKLRPFDEGLIFGQNLSQESKILPKTGLFQQNHLPSKTWHRLQIWAPVKFESVRK